jgi:phage/plasmid-associated DNA primase
MEELMKHYENKDIDKLIDSNEKLISFNDMVFDFSIGQYRNIQKSDYIMTTTGHNAPIKKNDKIRDDLNNIVKSIFEKEDNIKFFYESIGFSLFTNRFEKLHMWSGVGGNGKGLIMEIISKAFGEYFYVPDNQFLTTKYRGDRPNPSLYNTRNKKVVMVSEPEADKDGDITFNIEFVKKFGIDLTVGNSRDVYKIIPPCRIILNALIECICFS